MSYCSFHILGSVNYDLVLPYVQTGSAKSSKPLSTARTHLIQSLALVSPEMESLLYFPF